MENFRYGTLEYHFAFIRNNLSNALEVFKKIENRELQPSDIPEDIKKQSNARDIFIKKYIIAVVMDCTDYQDADILLAVFGFLQGYSDVAGLGNRRGKYCDNIGIYDEDTKEYQTLADHWQNDKNIKSSMYAKEKIAVRHLIEELNSRKNISNYVQKAKELINEPNPIPNYLKGEGHGYRECKVDDKVFYVPLTEEERRTAVNIFSSATQDGSSDEESIGAPADDSEEDSLSEESSMDSADNDEDYEMKSEKDSEQEKYHAQEKIDDSEASSSGEAGEKEPIEPPNPPTENKTFWKKLKLALTITAASFAGVGVAILAWGYFKEKINNKELLEQIASLNSDAKERDSVIATSIEVENKNITLAPGGYEYLVVEATPPEVDILFDLNYTSEPEGIVTIDKKRDNTYARVTALHVREEDMCDKVTITIQGSGTAGAKAYVFISSSDIDGTVGTGKNMDQD